MTSISDQALLPYPVKNKTLDKASWPPGPWHNEPDLLCFTHADLPCAIIRTHMGHFCGYVGVSKDHSFANGMRNISDLSVHGDVTWDKHSDENDLFWIGFDCGHSGDLHPSWKATGPDRTYNSGTYRDISYVRQETENLAKQLAAAVPLFSGPGPFTISEAGLLAVLKLFREIWDEDGFKAFCEAHITPTPEIN